MDAKHTPGPWRISKINPRIVESENPGLDTRPVSRTFRMQPEAEANARLIAAAPELLALLAQALNFIEHREANLGKLTTDEEWDANVVEYRKRGISGVGIGRSYTDKAFVNLDAIRAAIAKATGQ